MKTFYETLFQRNFSKINHGFCQGFYSLLKLKFPLVAFSPLKYLNIFGVPLINTSRLRVVGKFHKAPLNKFDFEFHRIKRNYHL